MSSWAHAMRTIIVGRARWNLVPPRTSHIEVVNHRQYCIEGEILEIYATVQALKETGEVIAIPFRFTSPVWLVLQLDGFGRTCWFKHSCQVWGIFIGANQCHTWHLDHSIYLSGTLFIYLFTSVPICSLLHSGSTTVYPHSGPQLWLCHDTLSWDHEYLDISLVWLCWFTYSNYTHKYFRGLSKVHEDQVLG